MKSQADSLSMKEILDRLCGECFHAARYHGCPCGNCVRDGRSACLAGSNCNCKTMREMNNLDYLRWKVETDTK